MSFPGSGQSVFLFWAIRMSFVGLTLPAVFAEEIPMEACDRLPVIRACVNGKELRLLVDTAATSMLNIKTFAGGDRRAIQVTSWSGTSLTSAREVYLPELTIGGHAVHDLRLPAIDLSPISEACRGEIDGILGVDLLERFGVALDLKNRLATVGKGKAGVQLQKSKFLPSLQACVEAFNRGDSTFLNDCFDPDAVLFTESGEIRGRDRLLAYLDERYFCPGTGAHLELKMRDSEVVGDALWFGYDLKITLPDQFLEARGMVVCRRLDDNWKLLSMHNSFEATRQ